LISRRSKIDLYREEINHDRSPGFRYFGSKKASIYTRLVGDRGIALALSQ
jgi:hypothetical protein